MSVTFGFYNSINHDRKYDSEQLSRIFDGVITDGVYHSVGEAFSVSAGTGMSVNVESGRAWFAHTWTYNDSTIVVPISASHQVYDRIDAVILRVDKSDRTNSICIKEGSPGSTPAKPGMESTATLLEVPLAYVKIPAATTDVQPKNIEFVVGTSECPFVAGVQNGVDIDVLVRNWTEEFDILFARLEDQITQAVSGTLIDGSVSFEKLAPDAVRRKFTNVTVPVSAFTGDETYADYPFRAAISLAGVNTGYTPEVILSVSILADIDFAPVAECYNGGVYIYAADKPTETVVIPTIICWR